MEPAAAAAALVAELRRRGSLRSAGLRQMWACAHGVGGPGRRLRAALRGWTPTGTGTAVTWDHAASAPCAAVAADLFDAYF